MSPINVVIHQTRLRDFHRNPDLKRQVSSLFTKNTWYKHDIVSLFEAYEKDDVKTSNLRS